MRKPLRRSRHSFAAFGATQVRPHEPVTLPNGHAATTRPGLDLFFAPEVTRVMGMAFDSAWQSLRESGSVYAADLRAPFTRTILAMKILQRANIGERDPTTLSQFALAAVDGSIDPGSRHAD
jgi:hypothetical protein